jgi:FMN reductase
VTTRTLAVVSAGLSVPSSTRLLADRLAGATVEALRERGVDATVEVVELREHARDLADNKDWGAGDATNRDLVRRVERAAGELADLVARRPAAVAADPFATATPFEALLRGA